MPDYEDGDENWKNGMYLKKVGCKREWLVNEREELKKDSRTEKEKTEQIVTLQFEGEIQGNRKQLRIQFSLIF